MKQFFVILKKAYELFTKRDSIAYFYGAKGEKLTARRMDELIAAYPNYYSQFPKESLDEVKRFSLNKTGYDCSGFLTAVTGISGNSASLYAKTVNKTTVKNAKAGSMLYKVGHCGLDIGCGYCLHIGTLGRTIEFVQSSKVGWTNAGEFPGYDYYRSDNY